MLVKESQVTTIHPADALQWRHYERDGVTNHQPRGCLLNRLFNTVRKQLLSITLLSTQDGGAVHKSYRKVSDISRTKSQNLNASRLIL